MILNLKRQTSYGSLRYFTIHKNGFKEKRLFNGFTTAIEVEVGDILVFREGAFQFYRKVIVTPEMKEIIITDSRQLKHLLSLSALLLFMVSFITLSVESTWLFFLSECISLYLFDCIVRALSYRFEIAEHQSWHSLLS